MDILLMSPRRLHLTRNMAETRFSTSDLKSVLDFSIKLAREAGEAIATRPVRILRNLLERSDPLLHLTLRNK